MVVTDLPATSDTCVWQENARLPSICTVQAPHRPVPQPNLVPVSLRSSRSTHNSGVAGGASVDAGLPFTTKLVAIGPSLFGAEPGDRLLARSTIIAPLETTGKAACRATLPACHQWFDPFLEACDE